MFKFHSFFPFLKLWLMPLFGIFFAAGADALAGGGGGSVLDAVVPDGGAEADTEDQPLDTSDTGAADVVDDTDSDPDAVTAAGAAVKAKPGITPEIAKALDALKATDPKAAKEIKAKLYAGAQAEKSLFTLKKEFPNGVADVLKLKQAIDTQLGGVDGLEELGADLSFYHDLDKKWEAKDPALVANLAAEYPEQFSAMVPHFLNKWAEVDAAGYDKMYAGMVINEIKGQNIPQALHMMNEYLAAAGELGADTAKGKAFIDKAVSIVGGITKWLGDLGKIASTPVPPKNGVPGGADKDNARAAQLDARESRQFNREVSTDYNSYRDTLMGKQLDEILAARKKTLTPERRDVVIGQALKRLSQKMHASPDFRKTVERYEKAKDRDGLIRFLKSRAGDALKGENGKAGIVAQAYQTLYGEGTLGTKKKDGGAPGDKGNVNPGAGWTKVAKAPAAKDISRSLTEAEGRKSGLDYEGMIMKNKYVLHNGTKVFHD